MSLFVVGLGLLSAGAAGLFGYAVHRANQKMVTLLDMQTLLRNLNPLIFTISTKPRKA